MTNAERRPRLPVFTHEPHRRPNTSEKMPATSVLPSQIWTPEPSYGMEQYQMVPLQMPRPVSQVAYSDHCRPYESPHMSGYQQSAHPLCKQSHSGGFTYDHAPGTEFQLPLALIPLGHYYQPQLIGLLVQHDIQRPSFQGSRSSRSSHCLALQNHHHHSLPNQLLPLESQQLVHERSSSSSSSSSAEEDGPPGLFRQHGMPEPIPRPKGPKVRFTPEDDALLVELKQTQNLLWKQIAYFFPGRSCGTLQVRYCTKLRAKTTVWTDEMVRVDIADLHR